MIRRKEVSFGESESRMESAVPTNPKREPGGQCFPSLALRVSVRGVLKNPGGYSTHIA
jgi:hypothetical protein